VLGFWPDIDAADAAMIAYTGGRSGPRKFVALTHRNLISSSRQLQQPFRIDETDRFLCALPLSQVATHVLALLTPWMAGASSVLGEPYSSQTLSHVQEARITVLAGTPRLYDVLSAPLFSGDYDISHLRLAVCHSGRVDDQIRAEFEGAYDALLVESYGLVEATSLCCANPYTGVRKPGSVGLPLPGQRCRVADADGGDLPAGRSGEILVRGPNVMRGYFGDPEATGKALRDGWLHTGDSGFTDREGYYYLAAAGAAEPGKP
jgi:long-chain acyl-CoA synthetase